MKQLNKLFSVLSAKPLMLLSLFALLPTMASAQSGNIDFADPVVKALCVANWDTNHDGELSYKEAASVTDLGTVFIENTEITSFNELQYFTKLTSIEEEAFSDCSGLTSVTIPKYVTIIGDRAFWHCEGLTSITIPNSVVTIGVQAFSSCSGLTFVSIPNSVTKIGWGAFWNCGGLTSVTIPNSVKSIGGEAFFCYNLAAVRSMITNPSEIPTDCWRSVKTEKIPLYVPIGTKEKYESTAGWNVFKNIVEKDFTSFDEGQFIIFADPTVKAFCIANWDTDVDGELSYDEAEAVTDLGKGIHGDITSFDEFQYFTGITSIPNNLFEGCRFSSITIPNSVKTIGNYAFAGSYLTNINIPNSVTSIGNNAFCECERLTSISISKSVIDIGHSIFYYCPALISIQVDEDNPVYDSRENCNAIIKTETNEIIGGCKNTNIPNTVTTIGERSFEWCSSLSNFIIPNSVTTIKNSAFSGCTGLTSLNIPSSVTSIGYGAFAACNGLTSIKVENGNTEYDSRDDCNAIIETRTNTLIVGCINTIIPNSVTTIGYAAFAGCSGLTSITIPNSVTGISSNAFAGCGLTSITIPSSVTYISYEAFWCCSNLTEVISLIEEPFEIHEGVFYNGVWGTFSPTLYVPAGCKAKYEATACWNYFTNIKEVIVINETNFPDENFRNWVLAQDYGQDGVLTEDEIAEVTYIDVSYQDIADLKGIEHFTALTRLSCYVNQLTSLDLSQNTALTYLNCVSNQLTALDLSQNTALTWLECSYNQLTSLDLSQNTALTHLNCYVNLLTSLDLSQNMALTWLHCGNNQLTSLDVSKNTALYSLECSGNQIYVTEMGKLVESLPTVNSGEFQVKYLTNANDQNVITASQVATAKAKGWSVLAYNGSEWVDYDGDEQEIKPIENGETINIGDEIDENTNLNGNVVDNVFVNISNGDGGFDPVEGCLIVSKPTDDSVFNGKDIFGDDFKDNYTGIVFKVNEDKGSIKVEAETQGNMVLKVKIGNSDPIEMELDGKLKVKFPYNVSEETLVYIYGGLSDAAGAKAMGARRAKTLPDLLKIYGFEIVSDQSGIEAVDNGQQTDADAPIYNLNGQRVNKAAKGVFIKNGRKVLVK